MRELARMLVAGHLLVGINGMAGGRLVLMRDFTRSLEGSPIGALSCGRRSG